jgi:stage II sporulation protein D
MWAWALVILFHCPPLEAGVPDIRVLIDEAPSVLIEGENSDLHISSSTSGKKVKPGKEATVTAEESRLVINGRDVGKKLEVTNRSERYRIGQRALRGTLSVIWIGQRKLIVVNELPIEKYLVGLLGSELSSTWPLPALMAQAVAARTYAMARIRKTRHQTLPLPYDIVSTVQAQVYHGAHREDPRLRQAVNETKGQVLTQNGRLISAYYHSCCGGRTERAENVWSGEAGPPPIDDQYCERSPKRNWSLKISRKELARVLQGQGLINGPISSIATAIHSNSPRTDMVLIEDREGLKMIKATRLRRLIGYNKIKSTWFEVKTKGHDVVFTGRGHGHGVGLCQWGAKGMAEAGRSYREILRHYYPHARISVAY